MKVVNPAGRNVETGMQADYSLRMRCKCSGGAVASSNTNSCACGSAPSIVQTNVYSTP